MTKVIVAVVAAIVLLGMGTTSQAAPDLTVSKLDTSVSSFEKCLSSYDGTSVQSKHTKNSGVIVWKGPWSKTVILLNYKGDSARIIDVVTNQGKGHSAKHNVAEFIDSVNTFCFNPVDTRSIGEKIHDFFN